MLTDTAIRKAKAADKTQRMFDGGGMYLEVAPSGGKWWRFKYRFGGKEKRISFGTYPDTGLAEAREQREVARKLLASGIDPGELRHAEWSEINLDVAEWTIPAGKMKMRQAHLVPLSDQAMAILRDLYPLTARGQYVFPGGRSPRRPMSNDAVGFSPKLLKTSKLAQRLLADCSTMAGAVT